MAENEKQQKRPTLAIRRASGPSTARLDRGGGVGYNNGSNSPSTLPLTERLNRADSPAESSIIGSSSNSIGGSATASTSYRLPFISTIQGFSKLTRSASSTTSASVESSRPQSLRSVSGSTAAFETTTTSTASPLITPRDDLLQDPLLGQRCQTTSPPFFHVTSQPKPRAARNNGAVEMASGGTFISSFALKSSPIIIIPRSNSNTEQGVAVGVGKQQQQQQQQLQDRDSSAGGTSVNSANRASARNSNKTRGHWDTTNTALNWMTCSSSSSSPSPSLSQSKSTTTQGQVQADEAQSEDIMRDELVSLTQNLSMNPDQAPSRASTLGPGEEEALNQQQEQLLYSAPQLTSIPHHHIHHPQQQQQSYSQHHPSYHHHHQHQQTAQYYTSIDGPSPDLYPASFQQSPVSAALGSMDSAQFETFRSTPNPYGPPVYGLSPSIAPTSTPQSPQFGGGHHHHTQSSDSAIFMYPNSYSHGMTTMTGLPGMAQAPPQSAAIMSPRSVAIGRGGPPTTPTANSMMMQSYHSPQSPMLMSVGPSGMDRMTARRESISYHNLPASYNQWATSPPSGGGFLHGHSPNWSGGGVGSFEIRPNHTGGHQRILSGGTGHHQQYPSNTMTFLPGSISPPSSLFRPAGSTTGRIGMHSRSASSFSQFSQQRSTTQSEVSRSALLEEFRSRHNKGRRFELKDIQGYIVEFSTDQHGSRFTQEKLDTANEEEMQMVFDELLPSALSLMTDVFGNYVIQKLFEHGTQDMKLKLVERMHDHVVSLSLGTYGCRVVQKALEHVDNDNQMRIANELRQDILTCVRDQNANHVVQKILECITPTTQVDFIPQVFVNNVYNLAAHCYSCRVLQRIFEHCQESQRRPLIDELLRDVGKLMHDQYGNYVIQWILQNASKPDKDVVINITKGNVLRLSRHKFASNVVEQVIRAASQEERFQLIEEILVPIQESEIPNEAPTVGAIIMMKDQYGNYVLQRFLELSLGQQKARLITIVKPALQNLKRFSSGYAKHLAAIERLLEASVVKTNAGTMTSKSVNGSNESTSTV